jgi:hypothetical protein
MFLDWHRVCLCKVEVIVMKRQIIQKLITLLVMAALALPVSMSVFGQGRKDDKPPKERVIIKKEEKKPPPPPRDEKPKPKDDKRKHN